jgi:hypothetical protein
MLADPASAGLVSMMLERPTLSVSLRSSKVAAADRPNFCFVVDAAFNPVRPVA